MASTDPPVAPVPRVHQYSSLDGYVKVLVKRPDTLQGYMIAYVKSTRHFHPSRTLELHVPGWAAPLHVDTDKCPPPLLPGSLTSATVVKRSVTVCRNIFIRTT